VDLNRQELQRLAQLGAQARLEALRREEAAIRAAFPDLVGRRRGRRPGRPSTQASGGGDTATAGPQRRGMSAAQRRAVSERMKRYWAERRKTQGAET
jgi:hypothetical protein